MANEVALIIDDATKLSFGGPFGALASITVGDLTLGDSADLTYPQVCRDLFSAFVDQDELLVAYGQTRRIPGRTDGFSTTYGSGSEVDPDIRIFGVFASDELKTLGPLPVPSSQFWLLSFADAPEIENGWEGFSLWPYDSGKIGDIVAHAQGICPDMHLRSACVPGGHGGYGYSILASGDVEEMLRIVVVESSKLGLHPTTYRTSRWSEIDWDRF